MSKICPPFWRGLYVALKRVILLSWYPCTTHSSSIWRSISPCKEHFKHADGSLSVHILHLEPTVFTKELLKDHGDRDHWLQCLQCNKIWSNFLGGEHLACISLHLKISFRSMLYFKTTVRQCLWHQAVSKAHFRHLVPVTITVNSFM